MKSAALILLFAALSAAQTCDIPDLPTEGSVDGTLAPSDCALRDFLPSANAQIRADAWRLRATDRTVFSIRMTSTEVDSMLYIFDDQKRLVARDNNSGGGKNAEFLIQLPAGTYTLVASSALAANGAYNLTFSSGPPRKCSLETLTLDTEVERDLTATDCRYADLLQRTNDRSYVDLYQVEVTRPLVLDIAEVSTSFETYVEIVDAKGNDVAYDDKENEGEDSHILVSLDPGTYLIRATSLGVGTGAYRLRTKSSDRRKCNVQQIAPGNTVPGQFAETDCRWLDVFAGSTDTTYINVFKFEVKQPQVAKIAMRSNTIDTVVVLVDSDGEYIDDNDDADDTTTDSLLVTSLRPGTYMIYANQIETAPGAYEVSLTTEDARTCPALRLELPGTASGTLVTGTGQCRVLDIVMPSSDATPATVYDLRVPNRGIVTLGSTSTVFNTGMHLLDDTGFVLTSKSGEPAAKIEVVLTPGMYQVILGTADGKTGDFTLTSAFRDPRVCRTDPIEVGKKIDAALETSDCGVGEVLPGLPLDLKPRIDLYKIDITQAQAITLKIDSPAFAPVLLILDPEFLPVRMELNLQFQQSLERTWNAKPGSYYIGVSDLVGLTGSYTISATAASSSVTQ